MNGESSGYLSPMRRLNLLQMNEDFWRRNTFDTQKIKDIFMDILVETDLRDEHLEALVALERAFRGTHPFMTMSIDHVPEGVTPRPLKDIERAKATETVADHIDKQVARGIKQESALQDAVSRFGVSRREAFRMLKAMRQRRIDMRATELAEWARWYDDFDITKDGRLVPRNQQT